MEFWSAELFQLSLCFVFEFLLSCSPFQLQASGYGSGDNENLEGKDEVKKIVEEREFTMVCALLFCFYPIYLRKRVTNEKASVLSVPVETPK